MGKKTFKIADLFCGAGGTSTGAVEALTEAGYRPQLTAINHWPRAIETHEANHPDARHLCTSVDTVDPRSLFRFGELDLLWGSPECMHHSVARGGKPINDQSRATAWCITRWAEALQPSVILVENVPEFREWGPIGTNGKPLRSKKGETFRAWLGTLESLGYKVDHRILCAADYGDPTTRRRLFVQAVRGRRKIRWPEQTHFPHEDNLFGQTPYVAAREIINWQHPSSSIFTRKKPLAENTIRRIEVGLRKFGLQPFFVPQQSRHVARGLERPYPTITGKGGEALCTPFLVQVNHGEGDTRRVHKVNEPLPTVTTRNGYGICKPFLVAMNGKSDAASFEDPLAAVCTKAKQGIAQPFIVRVGHYGKNGEGSVQVNSVDEPISTICTKQEHALAEPFLIHLRGTANANSIDRPAPTVTGGGLHLGLCKPFLTKFYGTADANSIDEPLDTVTTKERFGLVQPVLEIEGEKYLLDVHFRMLQPDELAAAQGFPAGYQFTGTKTEITKQIGNAVPCGLSRALVSAVVQQ